jgi:hypothetical protein
MNTYINEMYSRADRFFHSVDELKEILTPMNPSLTTINPDTVLDATAIAMRTHRDALEILKALDRLLETQSHPRR